MFEEDRIQTSAGELKITFVGHATLIFTFGGKVIHVDPYSRLADYEKLPKADVILITHSHSDHLDPKAIVAVRKEGTTVVLTEKAAEGMPGGIVMKNGETRTVEGIKIEAVPAYNLVHKRPTGEPFTQAFDSSVLGIIDTPPLGRLTGYSQSPSSPRVRWSPFFVPHAQERSKRDASASSCNF